MARPVARTAPAILLNVRSLIDPESALSRPATKGQRTRGNPAPYCARLSYTLPALAQPPTGPSVTAMNPIVIIPARMAATRLPGKPLADIGGVPMIVRVLRQAEASGAGPVA